MSRIGEKVKTMVRNWLQIQPAMQQTIMIAEPMNFEATVIRNKIWYRGDAGELLQLYRQLPDNGGRFWASVPFGEQIRKLHSGLPALMVDALARIVKSDLATAKFGEKESDDWNAIAEELAFTELVGKAVTDCLVTGDGTFKVSVNTDISRYPLCEFYDAEHVRYDMQCGRCTGVRFYTDYQSNGHTYQLEEHYINGRVAYTLLDGERTVDLNAVPELVPLSKMNPAEFDGGFMMAVPMKFFENPKFKGRGRSIFETKTDNFDAHDEVISQWVDAIRKGRVQRYIPEDLVPREPKTGKLLDVGAFGADYIKVAGNDTGEGQQIQLVQPDIDYQAYLNTYTATLNMCLQGILSPATLGIDLGKMSSAEAQREKKDITGHTRNMITSTLEKVLPKLIAVIMMTYDNMQKRTPGAYDVTVSFGEYGAPDFDSRIETVNKAAAAGTMSVEAQVEELWGDSKEEDWKAAEVARIKALRGIDVAPEPSPGDELIEVG